MSFHQTIFPFVFTFLPRVYGGRHEEVGPVELFQVAPHGILIHFGQGAASSDAKLDAGREMHLFLLPLHRVSAPGDFIAADVAGEPALVRTIAFELLEMDAITKFLLSKPYGKFRRNTNGKV